VVGFNHGQGRHNVKNVEWTHIASEGVLDRAPAGSNDAEPLQGQKISGESPMKLKSFQLLDAQRKQICVIFRILPTP